MATIKDCAREHIKIGKNSITIKNKETGKTKGIVKGIEKFIDLQPNKQVNYSKRLRELNIWGNRLVDMNCVLIDGKEIIILKDISSAAWHEKYGFFSDSEKEKYEKREQFYTGIKDKVTLIDCYVL